MTTSPSGGDVRQHATASGFARVFQAAGNMTVYEGAEPYRLAAWPTQGAEAQPGARAWEQPSMLLRASNALVRFTGRTDEQRRLKAWRDDPAPLAVRLLHGPGGQGKTRLAGQLAHEWAADGWVVIAAHHRRSPQAPDAFQAPALKDAAGVLLVVDYAERWDTTDLLALLNDTATGAGTGHAVRVLLLARPAGTWWQTLSYRIKHDLDLTATRTELGPLEDDPAVSRTGLFRAARDRFADVLEVPSAKETAPPEALTGHADYRLVLAVHMAALAAVLGHGRPEGPPSDPVEVSAYLLGRERAHWQDLHTRGEAPLATAPDAMGQVVYTATLTGPLSRTDAVEAVRRAAIESREHPGQLVKDHAVCYPPTPVDGAVQQTPTVLEPLYPDRLGEDYLALMTDGHPHDFPCDGWADDAPAGLLASTDDAPPVWTRHALTTLIEVAARWPHMAERQLYPLLRARPALALEAGGVALAALAALDDVDPMLLETIDGLLPDRHIDLDIAAAALATRLVEHRLRAAATPAERAQIHDSVAVRLFYAGQRDAALAEADTALGIWRELADRPDGAAYLPHLARASNNHAALLAKVGRRDEAVPVSRQAVETYRHLAAADPAAHLPAFATVLNNFANRLAETGRRMEAVTVSQQALDLRRRLVAAEPAAHLPDLANTLNNHSALLADVGRHDEALTASQQALDTYRDLADANRAAYLPDLAMALNNHALRLADAGRHDEAVDISRQAVDVLRDLAAANPAAHLPDFAGSLSNHANRLAEFGRHDEAIAVSQQAVDAYRDLAAADPAAYLPNLAMVLNNHSAQLADLGRHDEAIAISRQALGLRRDLAAANPAAYLPDLAATLTNHAALLSSVGRHDEAHATSQQAFDTYRDLADANPAAYLPDLATALHNHAALLSNVGRHDEAHAASQQALDTYRDLADANPAVHLPGLASALNNHALRQIEGGRPAEAVPNAQQAVDVFRHLADANPGAHLPDYSRSLTVLGYSLAWNARWAEAAAHLIEASMLAHGLPKYAQNVQGMIAGLLRRCYAGDPERTAEVFRALTGFDVPDWMKEPSSPPPAEP